MRDWMIVCFKKPFPDKPHELLDYILERGEEPCGPSIPQDILTMISFFEDVGGREERHKLGNDKMIKAIVGDLRLDLIASRPPRMKKKAHQLLVCFVASWEIMLCDSSTSTCLQTYLWVRLVMIWAALRTGDLAGIPAMQIVLKDGNLCGKIIVSKTTGSGKKISETQFHVSSEACLVRPGWLEAGWKIYCQSRKERPFMLTLPAPDFAQMSQKEPSYIQHCTSSRRLLADTFDVVFNSEAEEGWGSLGSSTECLLLPGAQNFWTGHSSRATLATWAACIKITKDRRDHIGRWKPSESDEYVRTSRDIVWAVQKDVAEAIKNAGDSDVCFEAEVLDELHKHSMNLGIPESKCDAMIQGIVVSRGLVQQTHMSLSLHEVSAPAPSTPPPDSDCHGSPDVDKPEEGPDEVLLGKGAWVVSCKRSGAAETLHQVGNCWRRPGIHYKRFVLLDDGEILDNRNTSDARLYSRVCADCFPKGIGLEASGSDSDSFVDSSGASDTENDLTT
jgi:hypothetical protein